MGVIDTNKAITHITREARYEGRYLRKHVEHLKKISISRHRRKSFKFRARNNRDVIIIKKLRHIVFPFNKASLPVRHRRA